MSVWEAFKWITLQKAWVGKTWTSRYRMASKKVAADPCTVASSVFWKKDWNWKKDFEINWKILWSILNNFANNCGNNVRKKSVHKSMVSVHKSMFSVHNIFRNCFKYCLQHCFNKCFKCWDNSLRQSFNFRTLFDLFVVCPIVFQMAEAAVLSGVFHQQQRVWLKCLVFLLSLASSDGWAWELLQRWEEWVRWTGRAAHTEGPCQTSLCSFFSLWLGCLPWSPQATKLSVVQLDL